MGYDAHKMRMIDHSGRWQTEWLGERGITGDQILYDQTSRNTIDEARLALSTLRRNGWSSVIAITDPPHMRRLEHVYAFVFRGSGCKYTLASAPMKYWRAEKWWGNGHSLLFVLYELIKLPYYYMRYT
jgi:hypothetical protein